MFQKSTYIKRRKSLCQTMTSGLVLFLGNNESPINYADNGYRFRQDSTFLYYFGLSRADLVATLDIENGEECIYGNDYTIDDQVWMGRLPNIQSQAKDVGINHSASFLSLEKDIKKAIQEGRKIHILPPYRADHTLRLAHLLNVAVDEIQGFVSEELCYAVANQRNYKSEEEITEINQAVDTSVLMHKMAMRMAKPGISEAELFATLEQIALKKGAGTSFPTIATINGQTLHNHYHGNTLKKGDLFLVDAGAENNSGYAGDLSSTIPVSGSFTSKQKDIYNLTLASHKKAIEMLAPGVPFIDIYYASARVIIEGMKDLGLMQGNTDHALENGAHAMFFPCGLGHMMGLDVHDMENLGETIVGYNGVKKSTQFGVKSLRLARPLEKDFVLTIEPGIYFIPELMDLWQSKGTNKEFFCFDKLQTYRDFGGIRNEEDFLITEKGYKRLGTIKKPVEINEVLEEWNKDVF